jgi:adenylate cyclase
MTETSGQDSGTVRFKLNGEKYLGQFQRTQRDGCPPRLIGTFLPERGIMEYADETMRFTIYITLGVIGTTVLLSFWLSRQVAQPLEKLTEEVAKVGQMHLGPNRHISSVVREVDRLALAAEEMKAGLRSFRKYVPADLVREVLSTGREARLGGELRRVTISFSDIVGFTSISEKMPSDLLVKHLGDYLAALSEEIMQLGGTVDKFIGDAIMAFWGAPTEHPEHATAACVAALHCRQRLRKMAPIWEAAGKPPLRTRFGIHTGEVIVGNIGSPQRMNYTIIGDAVNLASRMEGLNKHYGTEILLSEETYRAAQTAIVARPIDWVVVKGRGAATQIYELLGLRSEACQEISEFADRYAAALQLFRSQRWIDAATSLSDLLCLRPDDAPSQSLLRRCQEFIQSPPAENWDGLAHMASK